MNELRAEVPASMIHAATVRGSAREPTHEIAGAMDRDQLDVISSNLRNSNIPSDALFATRDICCAFGQRYEVRKTHTGSARRAKVGELSIFRFDIRARRWRRRLRSRKKFSIAIQWIPVTVYQRVPVPEFDRRCRRRILGDPGSSLADEYLET